MECVIEERTSFCSSGVSEKRRAASQRSESCPRWEMGEMMGGVELFFDFLIGGVST